jgi:acetyltransferase EpsM
MLIHGISGYAKTIHDLARAAGVTVQGFVAADAAVKELLGLPVVSEQDALQHPAGEIVVAETNPQTRKTISARFASQGWTLKSLAHPQAVVASGVQLGAGSIVLAGAVIQAGATVGSGTIVNANATVDYDAVLGDYVHACPGAVVGGGSKIGEGTWIGANAAVIENLTVGAWTMVGAGATVVGDVADEVVVYGVPAEVRRQERFFPVESAAPAAANAGGASQVRDTVADVINTILRDTGRETRAFASQDILMGNIGLDSLDLAVMTVSLEQRIGKDPFRSGRGAVRSFGELVAVYEESLRESAT